MKHRYYLTKSDQCSRSANGIILCYDMTCRQSFESLQRWLDDVSKFAAPNVAKVLVGSFGLFSYLCQDVLSSSRLLLKEGGGGRRNRARD